MSNATARGVPLSTCAWVRQNFLANLTRGPELSSPVQVPLSALRQRLQGHDGFGVVAIPTHARTLQPRGERLAGRLCGTAADLPAFGQEIRIRDHFAPFVDIAEQSVCCFSLAPAQANSPL